MPYNTTFTPSALITDLPVWGKYQRFLFNQNHSFVRFGPYSQFVPTSKLDSNINIDTRNYNYSGFRWNHNTKVTDTNGFGSFKFQCFVGENLGTDIFGYDGINFSIYTPIDVHNNRIQNLLDGTADTDAVNLRQLNAAISSGTVILTGDVTGSGITGTPIPTTITLPLNSIPAPTANVSLNSKKITNVANGTVSTDAVNLGQLNAAISTGTVTLTGDVTGSGVTGTPFPTTLTLALNNIPIPTGP